MKKETKKIKKKEVKNEKVINPFWYMNTSKECSNYTRSGRFTD